MKKFISKKVKSIVGVALILAMMLSFSGISASEEMSKDERAIAEKVAQSVTATITGQDSENIDAEILAVEVKEVPLPTQYKGRAAGARAYEAKIETNFGDYSKNSVNASGVLTMTWIDGPWTENEIVNLKGYWQTAKGTFEYGIICWGGDYGMPGNSECSIYVGEHFDEDIEYLTNSNYGTLKSSSLAYFTNAAGETVSYRLNVNPTILD